MNKTTGDALPLIGSAVAEKPRTETSLAMVIDELLGMRAHLTSEQRKAELFDATAKLEKLRNNLRRDALKNGQ